MELSIDKYLERIGYKGSREINRANLFALQKAHLMSVPYENLDIYYGRHFSLSYEDMYDKIVNRHRGGYCFELNGLFAWLLRGLGYTVDEYFGRWLAGEQLQAPARRHRILKVRLPEGDYLVDAAVGRRAPLTPLEFNLEIPQEREGMNYRIIQDDLLGKVVQGENDGKYTNIFSFDEAPQLPIDFMYVNYYCVNNPDSVFRKVIMVHIPTIYGRNSIAVAPHPESGEMLPLLSVDTAEGNAQKCFLFTQDDLNEALKYHFGIVM